MTNPRTFWRRTTGGLNAKQLKRLKSLAQLGHLPKYDDQSSRAWLYGKLFVALLTQKLIRTGRELSPWGYVLGGHPSTQ